MWNLFQSWYSFFADATSTGTICTTNAGPLHFTITFVSVITSSGFTATCLICHAKWITYRVLKLYEKNHTVILVFYYFERHAKNHSCDKESKEFVAWCNLFASDSILVVSLSRSNPVFNIWISSGFLWRSEIFMKLFLLMYPK